MEMKTPAHKLVVPRDRLSADAGDRFAALSDYFGDLLASAELSAEGWVVQLKWPDFDEYFVDPLVPTHLGWWQPGMRVGEMRRAAVWSGTGQLSLDDAWTLFAWSRWLQARYREDQPPAEVAVIHVDDHRDMMSPRIAWDGTQWNDLLSGRRFTVFDPESVRAAILSGAIGVGSFFAPFLHQLPSVVVRHLSQSAGLAEDGREWLLLRESADDTIIMPGHLRPGIRRELVRPGMAPQADGVVAGRYRFTQTYEWCLADLPLCPVLLHIDMDYFNNRYDRDSDWRDRPNRLDPSEPTILGKIDEFFAVLDKFGVAERVEDVTVALSPGFFPAEYWSASVERIERHLAALGMDLGCSGNGQVLHVRPG
jgi:hypothetical protein